MFSIPRFTILGLLMLTAAVAVVLAIGSGLGRKRVIETLQSPVEVTGWTTSGLKLKDGRTLLPPGLSELPVKSFALSEATQRGIEIGEDGRLYALVRIFHWCGNDSVGEHVARVDLANYLIFLGEGGSMTRDLPEVSLSTPVGGDFTGNGWNVGEYFEFWDWERLAEHHRRAAKK